MHRHQRALLISALVLLTVGLLGMTVTGLALLASSLRRATGMWTGDLDSRDLRAETFSSPGERIFFTGAGRNGPITIYWDPDTHMDWMMPRGDATGPARMGCAACHGSDGRGRRIWMMGSLRSGDIRYSSLRVPHRENGRWEPGMTDEEIERAIRTGVEPDGDELDPIMPRWDMNATEMRDLFGYLRQLDRQ